MFFSDLGTQLVAGSNIIQNFLNDPETSSYFKGKGVQTPQFEHYYKGHSELGSLVESCVKIVKKLIFGSIKKNVLTVKEFYFLISKIVYLVNHRPIAYKESLSGSDVDCPEPITPDLLIKGYTTDAINIIPNLQPVQEDEDWLESTSRIKNNFSRLSKVRAELIKLYNEDFLNKSIDQSVSRKGKYKPVSHKTIKVGDIVLLKEEFHKSSQYPMGVVKEVVVNSLGEVTGATVLKGCTRELVKRHSSVLIPLLSSSDSTEIESDFDQNNETVKESNNEERPIRQAAIKCKMKNRVMLNS